MELLKNPSPHDSSRLKGYPGLYVLLIGKRNDDEPMAVMMSYTDYERLREIEEAFWAKRATEAEKSGYLGENSMSELMCIKALKDNNAG